MLLAMIKFAVQNDPWTGPDKWALAFGIIGTILGFASILWNCVQYGWRTKVSLKVKPALAEMRSGLLVSTATEPLENGFLVANIINESHFPITLTRVSVQLSAISGTVEQPRYETNPDGPWPRKLDRKEAVTVILRSITCRRLLSFGIKTVNVETADGTTAQGTCPVLQALHRKYRSLPKDDLGIAQVENAEL